MSAVNRPGSPCPNEHCGNTLYVADYARNAEDKLVPVWQCTNCMREYPRATRNRPTNERRAHLAWQEIRDAWEETDSQLHTLIDAGQPNGCLLVYGRTFNYHLDKLFGGTDGKNKWTNWGVKYHTQAAREDLEKAKQFVHAANKPERDTLQ
jgi:hypothetical protein